VQVATDLGRTIQDLQEVAEARAIARTEEGTPPLMTEVANVIQDALNQGVPEASLLSTIRSSVSALLSTMQKRERTVFLSYATYDIDVVDQIVGGLRDFKFGVSLRRPGLEPDESGMQEIERVLSAADFVVFFISPHSVKSPMVLRELRVALHRQVSGEGG